MGAKKKKAARKHPKDKDRRKGNKEEADDDWEEVVEEVSFEALIEKANVAMGTMKLDEAEAFYRQASAMQPINTSVMDALSDTYLQKGNYAEALALLTVSCDLAPTENVFKWLYMAQLQCGLDAISSYRSAISHITEHLNTEKESDSNSKYSGGSSSDSSSMVAVITTQLVKAHCSVAELYLTDLCFEDNAEGFCEEAVNKALSLDATSLDGLQTLASLRISQNRKKEACELVKGVCLRITKVGKVGGCGRCLWWWLWWRLVVNCCFDQGYEAV
jgi:tetratricopeptide (TPR) repeat protein